MQQHRRNTSGQGAMCLIHSIFPDSIDHGFVYCSDAEQELQKAHQYAVNETKKVINDLQNSNLSSFQSFCNDGFWGGIMSYYTKPLNHCILII